MPKTEQTVIINAPIEHVFSVIRDYESYPEFLPEMAVVEVLERNETTARVRFELELIMRISYVLALEETPPRGVSWRLDEAKMLAYNAGEWRLRSVDADRTEATYSLDIKLHGLVPRSVSEKLTQKNLPETLERFKSRAESTFDPKKT